MPFPIAAAIQGGAGIIQSILGGIAEKKALKKLENLQTPTYTPNQGILDYYNKALARYETSPTDSALYKRNRQNILRGTSSGVGMLQDRRSGQAGIPGLIRAQNDAMLNTEVQAENQKNQRFGEYGGATGMKAGEDRAAWEQNVLAPYEKQFNLLAAKAGQKGQMLNAGLSNIFGAGTSISQLDMLKKMYPNK